MTGKNEEDSRLTGLSRGEEEENLSRTLAYVRQNVENYTAEERRMQADIEEMLEHYHDNDPEIYTILSNTITMHEHVKQALEHNERALKKPYFGRIGYLDERMNRMESFYIGKCGISTDAAHHLVIDWRAPVANVYYENGLGKCRYISPGGEVPIELRMKRTYEIEDGKLLDFYDTEVVANDDLLMKYLGKNKQAVLGEIVATIQKEQNEIIRCSPYHNLIVQGVAGSGKTTVAMHRISYILYNYEERFRPEDFYIVGSNRILLNYITSVLPDLDVYGVRQMTMEELFVRLLYEKWDKKKYGIRAEAAHGTPEDRQQADRGSRAWFQDLKGFCDRVEWESISREPVYLDRRRFVEGFHDGRPGVHDLTKEREAAPGDQILLLDQEAVESYIRENPGISVQSKILMLNKRLLNKVKTEISGGILFTEAERKEILRAYRGYYGGRTWKRSIYDLYREFLLEQREKGMATVLPEKEFDVYDLAALAYLYKRFCETETVSEAHHIVIDEAQDFGMMAYEVLNFCVRGCTYTVMGDVSQNIHFGHGLNDWEELKEVLLPNHRASFRVLRKSYRNTVEISEFAGKILAHGHFSIYPPEPILRHGEPVAVREVEKRMLVEEAVRTCEDWQRKGYETIAVICRNETEVRWATEEMSRRIPVLENDLERASFGVGILVLSVEYTKGLEFDTVLILDPSREDYPVEDGHAKLLYVAATRALHELCVLHTGNLTGLIADPPSEGR